MLVAYFSTWVLIQDIQWPLLKAFKIWHHYLSSSKHKALVFTVHNSLCQFMNTMILSPRAFRSPFSSQLLSKQGEQSCRRFLSFLPKESKWKKEAPVWKHWLQPFLTNVSFFGICLAKNFILIHQDFIVGRMSYLSYISFKMCSKLGLLTKFLLKLTSEVCACSYKNYGKTTPRLSKPKQKSCKKVERTLTSRWYNDNLATHFWNW